MVCHLTPSCHRFLALPNIVIDIIIITVLLLLLLIYLFIYSILIYLLINLFIYFYYYYFFFALVITDASTAIDINRNLIFHNHMAGQHITMYYDPSPS